jgi:hypothetical protein
MKIGKILSFIGMIAFGSFFLWTFYWDIYIRRQHPDFIDMGPDLTGRCLYHVFLIWFLDHIPGKICMEVCNMVYRPYDFWQPLQHVFTPLSRFR